MATVNRYGAEVDEQFSHLQDICLKNTKAIPTFQEDVRQAMACRRQILEHFHKDESVKAVHLWLDVPVDLEPGGSSGPVGNIAGYRLQYGTLPMVRGTLTHDTGETLNVAMLHRVYHNDGSNHYQGEVWVLPDGNVPDYSYEWCGIMQEPLEVKLPVFLKQIRACYSQYKATFGVQSTDSPAEKAERDILHNIGLGEFAPSERAIERSNPMQAEDISQLSAEDNAVAMDIASIMARVLDHTDDLM